MPNIRIKDIPTTASATSSTDFIGIDGSANGTRKLNAFSPTFGGNLTVSGTTGITATDLTLGSSGPSVKSTLSARAPRQGLVFDGTAGATVTLPAFGTGDFTVAAWINASTITDGADHYIVGGPTNSFAMRVEQTTGVVSILRIGGGLLATSTPAAITVGKQALVCVRRSGSTNTFSINGIDVGTPVTDSTNYSAASTKIGNTDAVWPWKGTISGPYIYNRALSASEVVALYEAGDPAGSDYGASGVPASNTSLITGTNSDFSGAGNWTNWSTGTVSVGSGVGTFTAGSTGTGGGYRAAYLNQVILSKGKRYRFVATVGSLTGGNVILADGEGTGLGVLATANGTASLEFTVPTNSVGYLGLGGSAIGTSYTLDNVFLYPIGLLLAPDAAQAGGGLVWYDTSGNAANITLPASGVSWNVPSSAKTATGWTFGGAINATGTSVLTAGYWRTKPTADDGTLTGLSLANSGGTQVGVADVNTLTGEIRVGGTSSAYYLSFYSKNSFVGNFGTNGELLLGTNGVNSSNGKLQLATHTTSAGGIGFGTDISLYRPQAGVLAIDGSQAALYLRDSGTTKGRLNVTASTLYIDAVDASGSTGQIILRTGNGGGTALTLDSSQNATFAGTVTASTAGNYVLQLKDTRSQAADVGASIGLQGTYTGSLQTTFGSILGLKVNSTDGNFAGKLVFQTRPNGGSLTTALTLDDSQNATFAGYVNVDTTSGAAYRVKKSNNASGAQSWNSYVDSNGTFTFQCANDNFVGANTAFSFTRSGLTPTGMSISATTASTTTGSGALQVSGGVGVAGAVNVGTYYGMVDGVTAPAATSGYAKIYVDTADGDLKVIFGDGTIKTIATDT